MSQMQKKKPAFNGFGGGGGNSGLNFSKKPVPKKTDVEKFDEAEKQIQAEKDSGGCGCW